MPGSPTPGSPLANQAIGAVLGAVAAGKLSQVQRQALLGQLGQLASQQPGLALPGLARPGPPAALETIRAQDQGFEIETFLQRAEMTFFLVKRGLQQNNAAAVRPFLNDAVFSVVSRSIADTSTRHRHQLMESLNVRAVHLVDATCDAQGQSLLVHFDLVYRAKPAR